VFKDLFRSRLTKDDNRFVAACLLRVLAADRDAISVDDMRRYVTKLFDEVLVERLYHRVGIDPGDRDTTKLLELPGVELIATSSFARVIESFDRIEDIRRFQHDLMQATQDATYTSVIRPFLPEEALTTDFKVLARRLEDCANLSSDNSFASYQAAETAVERFLQTAESHQTEYSDRFLVPLAKQIQSTLQESFEKSPLSRPAILRLVAGDKKYPLHAEGEEVRLKLQIENRGEGPAYDVVLTVEPSEIIAPLEERDQLVGNVPADGRTVVIPALVLSEARTASLSYLIVWTNANGEEGFEVGEVALEAQKRDVDWERLAAENPYPSKAVDDPDRLAGRRLILTELEALATGAEVGSARISGQKRVGKSSIVRSLDTRLNRLPGPPLLVAYVDITRIGIGEEQPVEAVAAVFRAISRAITKASATLATVPVPDYRHSLEEFSDFLDEVRRQEPDRRVLVILDEFDELPNAAFDRGGPGDPMFRFFKSFSSEGECGFFVVGGERLELALSRQGDRVHAFREFRVDYIGEDDTSDFHDLVTRPVEGFLEFEGSAVEELRSRTGGHPFYTFAICREILESARERHDAHITAAEVEDAYWSALREAPASYFAHIWFDHIFDDIEALSVTADRRVRVLLSLAECSRAHHLRTLDNILTKALDYEVPSTECREELRAFVNRKILTIRGDEYFATSQFFEDWLKEWGSERIREQPELRSLERISENEDQRRIRSQEVVELSKGWPLYRTQQITPEQVRGWLEQFGESDRQRLALKLLQGVRFYSSREVREAFVEAHREARRDTKVVLAGPGEKKQVKSRDFAVCYIESDGKSAQLMAQSYADANRISRECVASIERVESVLGKYNVQRLVLVDDFVGTGGTLSKRLAEKGDAIRVAAERTGRGAILAIVAGFETGLAAIQDAIEVTELPLALVPGSVLDETDRAFSDSATVFDDAEERMVARRMVESLGRSIGSREPLGTGDQEALVVFEHNCPNNTLPVLWRESTELSWTPLFPRVTQ
jgi:hypothetical protein